jgi:hypothetical protein
MRHDRVWGNLVGRAIKQGGLDVETFVRHAIDSGMSEQAIQDRLLSDLETGGPIFGKFFRHLGAAAEQTSTSAHRTGGFLGDIATDPQLSEMLDLADMDDVIEIADPEVMDSIQQGIADRDERMWVAELRNTCHLCLPLHGTIMTMAEWQESGLHPDTIHPAEWGSKCHCHLVPVRQVGDRTDVMAPLVRNRMRSATGLKGRSRTYRGVTQADHDRAMRERDKAMVTLEGRRTLRLLGQSTTENQVARTREDIPRYAARNRRRQPERPKQR